MVRHTQPRIRVVDRSKVSPFFQTELIILSLLFLSAVFTIRMDYFRFVDELSEPEAITPSKLRDFGSFPELITVGLNIERFQQFDVIKNRFEFTGNLWFEMEAGAVSIATLENFNFSRGTILFRSPADIKLFGTRLLVRYVVRVVFNSGLVFNDFPLDDHRISLELTNPFLSPEEVIFDGSAENFINQSHLFAFGWKNKSQSVKSGFLKAQLTRNSETRAIYQPIVSFNIDVERYGFRHSFSILLPILLIFYLMFFSLSVDPTASVTIALGGITGILAYRYVIEQLSPFSGDLMISDYIFFLILASSFTIFFINNIDLFFIRFGMRQKRIMIALIHLFTIIISTCIMIP